MGLFRFNAHKLYGNQSGLSIIEVLIASSIGLVMMMAFGSFLMSQLSATQDIAHTFEINAMRSRITETLSEVTACTQNFGNRNPNVIQNMNSIVNRTGVPSYSVSQNFGNGLLSIASIQRDRPAAFVGPNSKGQFNLTVVAHKRGRFLGANEIPITVPVFFTTNATNRVDSCSTQGVASQIMCQTRTSALMSNNCSISCSPGTKLTGGGCNGSNLDKRSFTSRPITSGSGAGVGWTCSSSGSTLTCYAVCCN